VGIVAIVAQRAQSPKPGEESLSTDVLNYSRQVAFQRLIESEGVLLQGLAMSLLKPWNFKLLPSVLYMNIHKLALS
jgi:hypothetical protein